MRSLIAVIAVSCAAGLVAGCAGQASQRDPTPPPQTQRVSGNVEHLADVSVEQERSDQQVPTAVERAVQWSEKYSRTAERLVAAQKARNELEKENQQLLAKVARLQTELDRAKQELRDANQMLVEMREELSNWKTNVLGFRDEMRQAQQAQIERLKEIIELLGGEVPSASTAETTDQTKEPSGASVSDASS